MNECQVKQVNEPQAPMYQLIMMDITIKSYKQLETALTGQSFGHELVKCEVKISVEYHDKVPKQFR